MTAVDERTRSEQLLEVVQGPRLGGTRARRVLINVGLYALFIAIAMALASLLVIWSTDASPFDVVRALYDGSLSNPEAIGITLREATPILIVALGVVIAGRAGTFTIGPEGQFLIGGLCAAWVVFKFGMPAGAALPIALVASALGGALWAGIAAVLRYTRKVDIIISTLLLNFVAAEVVSYFLNKTWLLQEVTDRQVLPTQSPRLAPSFQLPALDFGTFRTTSALLLAIGLTAVVWVALGRTRWGFKIKMLGMNANAARAAGVSMALVGGGALILSGAFAGLAGGVWFTGIGYRLVPGFGGNIGGNGLLVALIARRSVIACVPIAFFFGALQSGGTFLAASGIPSNIVDIVQALVVLAALMPPAVLHVWERRKAVRVARQAASAEMRAAEVGVAA